MFKALEPLVGWLSAAESTLGVGVPRLGSDKRFSSGLGGHLCIAVQPRCSWASTAQGPASSVRKGADQHQLWLPELHGFPHQCVCCGSLEVESWGGREERGLAPRTQISQTSETGFGGSIQTTDGMLFGALVLIT